VIPLDPALAMLADEAVALDVRRLKAAHRSKSASRSKPKVDIRRQLAYIEP
jgi:hypothetical protein